jgi:ferredoxin
MVFAAATTGGMPGAILRQAARLLRRRGLPLSAGVHLPYSLRPEDAAIRESRLDELCGAIRARRADAAASGSLVDRLVLTGIGNSLARLLIPKEDRSFEAGASCEGCGTCARLCPAGNIELEDGKPRWKGHCEQCGACFAWCGRAAIAGKCLAARTRYTNPGVSLSEMLDLAEDRLRPQNPMLRSSATKEA